MELRHFNPQEEHPISCQRCGHQISGPYYRRQRPRISLHKHCAELSGKNKHPLHQDHTLKLSSSPPKTTNSTDKLKTCNLCHETLYGFTYICSCNDFAIDSVCALMLNKIDHPSHHHQLTPFHNPATFFCHGCRRQRKGISYLCTSCKFWVHQECAWAPSSFRRSDHRHSLTLAYSLPEKC
ncbi:Protein kinase C [Bertholletia excelsa]